MKRNHKLATRKFRLFLYISAFLFVAFTPGPARSAFLLMDAPAWVYAYHEFEVDLYLYNASDVYGLAYDNLYDEILVDVVDSDSETEGIQPYVTESDFLNDGGSVDTILRKALQDARKEGVLVLGLARSGQIEGIDTGVLPEHLMSVRYKAEQVGFANFQFDLEGIVDSFGDLIELEGGTGVTVEIVEFDNHPPNMPSNPSPADQATEIGIAPQLSWEGGDQDEDDIVTYHVYLDENNPPETLVASFSQPWDQLNCLADVTVLANTVYYWQVVATDNYQGLVTTGPVWEFTTLSATPTPYISPTPAPTNTPEPTVTVEPTNTPEPTNTLVPTNTPAGTAVPTGTATPIPPIPTATASGLLILIGLISFVMMGAFRRKKR